MDCEFHYQMFSNYCPSESSDSIRLQKVVSRETIMRACVKAKSNLQQVLEATTQAAANCTTSSGSWGHPSCPPGMLPQEQHLGHLGVIQHSAAPGTGPLTPQPLQAPIILPTGERHQSKRPFIPRYFQLQNCLIKTRFLRALRAPPRSLRLPRSRCILL